MLLKTQKKTTRFLLFAVLKPCYVRATEICSTFSRYKPHKLVVDYSTPDDTPSTVLRK